METAIEIGKACIIGVIIALLALSLVGCMSVKRSYVDWWHRQNPDAVEATK